MIKSDRKKTSTVALREQRRSTLPATAGDEEYVQELARYLDRILDEKNDEASLAKDSSVVREMDKPLEQ